MVILLPDMRFHWTPPDSYDQLTVAEGTLRTSQLNSVLPPTATIMEGRGLPNSGWPERIDIYMLFTSSYNIIFLLQACQLHHQ